MISLNQVLRLLSDFKRNYAALYGLQRIGVFGSVARGEQTDDSDIDIVVEVTRPSLAVMSGLQDTLQQLFDTKVDLVRYRQSLRPLLKHNIDQDTIYVDNC